MKYKIKAEPKFAGIGLQHNINIRTAKAALLEYYTKNSVRAALHSNPAEVLSHSILHYFQLLKQPPQISRMLIINMTYIFFKTTSISFYIHCKTSVRLVG